MFRLYLDLKPLFQSPENLESMGLLRYKFPLTCLLFKVGQAINSLIDPYNQASVYQHYYNLTRYIFHLHLASSKIQSSPSYFNWQHDGLHFRPT